MEEGLSVLSGLFRSWTVDISGTPDEWFEKEFENALEEIDWKSSPGICSLSCMGATNGQVFGWNGKETDPVRTQIVKTTAKARMRSLLLGLEVSDPLMVFVKSEPHKTSKIEEGRFRLISAVSLVDTLVDRILYGWLGRRALQTVGATPVMVGWTPLNGGWRMISNVFAGRDTACLDKTAWDWTVQGYMVDVWETFIKDLILDPPEWWLVLHKARFKQLYSNAVFQFRDGSQFEQSFKGVMKSGCFLTIILNSVSQVFLHLVAQSRLGFPLRENLPLAMGDDTVQFAPRDLQGYIEALRELGALVKEAEKQNWVEFCGMVILPNCCFPSYWKKHLFNLHYGEFRELLESYQILYANEPGMLRYLRKVAHMVQPSLVVTEREARRVLNGQVAELTPPR